MDRPNGLHKKTYVSLREWKTSRRSSYTQYNYRDVIMSGMASQITGLLTVCWTVYPGADQSKHQSSASLAFVWGTHRRPVNSPQKGPVTRKMFPFDDVIMMTLNWHVCQRYRYLKLATCGERHWTEQPYSSAQFILDGSCLLLLLYTIYRQPITKCSAPMPSVTSITAFTVNMKSVQ